MNSKKRAWLVRIVALVCVLVLAAMIIIPLIVKLGRKALCGGFRRRERGQKPSIYGHDSSKSPYLVPNNHNILV